MSLTSFYTEDEPIIWINKNNVAMPTTSLYLQPDAMLAITAPASTFHVKVKSVSAVFHANWKKLKYGYHCKHK